METTDEMLYWLALNDNRGVLPHYLLEFIISNYGTLKSFFDLTEKELINLRLKNEDIIRLKTFKQKIYLDSYRKDLEYAKKNNTKIIRYVDKEYPAILKQSSTETLEPPVILFRKGLKIDFVKSAAIVGTRKASRYSRSKAREFSRTLAEDSYWIISGMANGIDTEAHRGALIVENGKTIAVLPWMNPITPLSNEYLSTEIMKNGCLISEKLNQPERSSLKYPYIERNRITSGLSDFLIAVESGPTGGTIRQVDLAVSQNKPIYTLYPLEASEKDKIQGFNTLIQKGCKPINNVSEITEFKKHKKLNNITRFLANKEYRLSYGNNKEEAILRLISMSEFYIPDNDSDIIELENRNLNNSSYQKYYLIKTQRIVERPNCPRCGGEEIISRGKQWHCKSCGRYFSKHKIVNKKTENRKQTTL